MHLTSNPVDWYAARAAGITAYALLSGVVLLGLTMAGKKSFARWPRFTVEDVHRFGGLLIGSFVALHIVTVAIDSWLPFTLQSLIVPFTTKYRPIWVGLGVAAAELLAALAITNHYRRRMTYGTWRRAHYLNFAVWTAAVLHGLGSGTDRSAPWSLAVYGTTVSAVAAATVWRFTRGRVGALTVPAAGLAALAALSLVVGFGLGPLRFRPRPWNAASFNEALTGRVVALNGFTRGIVSMTGQGQGRQGVLVRADLLVTTRKLLKTSFQMEYLPSGALCTGEITTVRAMSFAAVCHLENGLRRVVKAHWQPGESSELVGGRITAHP
jgi:methionine sulfoxide reductase heme-binding subunit